MIREKCLSLSSVTYTSDTVAHILFCLKTPSNGFDLIGKSNILFDFPLSSNKQMEKNHSNLSGLPILTS